MVVPEEEEHPLPEEGEQLLSGKDEDDCRRKRSCCRRKRGDCCRRKISEGDDQRQFQKQERLLKQDDYGVAAHLIW